MNKADKFQKVTAEMLEIYKAKNTDYGNSFEKSLNEFGPIAFVVRASDKIERIKQLVNNEAKVKDESFTDTVRDLANYCVMYLIHSGDEGEAG